MLGRLSAVALLTLALAACGGKSSSPSTTAPTTTSQSTTTTADEMVVTAYFLRGEKVAAAHVTVPRSQAVAAASMRALLAGPPQGLGTSVPDGTTLRGVTIDDKGVATVDLSGEYASGGGSLSMLTRVAQVVYTLTQFPNVKGVLFELDGKRVDAIGGEGIVVATPQSRKDFEGQTPIILVESPAPGDVVTSPITVRGTSNTFEATLQVRLVQGGKKLYEHFVTATSGTGERGTFTTQVPFTARGPATLEAFEYSAKDGSEIHKVRIPVTLAGG